MEEKMLNNKISNNQLKDILADLQLFQQTNYCYNYIKNKYPNGEEAKILYSSKVASACFRQANEFIISAQNANLSTNPLLYSYALNNFVKGMAYLLYLDEEMLKYFKDHGFYISNDNIKKNILETNITLKQCGVPTFILRLYNNIILKKQEISFELLLSQIPEISSIFNKTTLKMSNVAKKVPNTKGEFEMYCRDFKQIEQKKEISEEYGIHGTYDNRTHILHIGFNMKGKEKIEHDDTIKNNLFYNDYLILPNKFENGIYSLNLMFYCYLLIMSYGMLVRYNAHKWENFIDPKISKESTLIAMSVDVCVTDFLTLLHQKLLGYTYIESKYNDYNVKKVIQDSTHQIMNNIASEITHYNLQYGKHYPLPWPKKMQ